MLRWGNAVVSRIRLKRKQLVAIMHMARFMITHTFACVPYYIDNVHAYSYNSSIVTYTVHVKKKILLIL
jgi:cytochrome c oxidase assembly protein Cox11